MQAFNTQTGQLEEIDDIRYRMLLEQAGAKPTAPPTSQPATSDANIPPVTGATVGQPSARVAESATTSIGDMLGSNAELGGQLPDLGTQPATQPETPSVQGIEGVGLPTLGTKTLTGHTPDEIRQAHLLEQLIRGLTFS